MITLGLDPSLTGFGWAIHNSTVVGPPRVLAKGVIRTSADQVIVWRYMHLRQCVTELICAYPEVENVGLESSVFGAEWSEGAYGLFLYVLEAVYLARKDLVLFDPGTVKSLAKMDSKIRRGTMDKKDMVEAAIADTTVKKWDHNEADAYIVARSAAHFWENLAGVLLEEELTPSERNSFLQKKTVTSGRDKGKTVMKGIISKEGDRFFRFSLLPPHPPIPTPTFR